MVFVESCCCGCTLEQGTIGAGVFALVDVGFLLVVGCRFIYVGYEFEKINRRYNSLYSSSSSSHHGRSSDGRHNPVLFASDGNVLMFEGIMMCGVAVIFLTVTIFVLCSLRTGESEGARSRRKTALVPWLVVAVVQVLLIMSYMIRVIPLLSEFPFYVIVEAEVFLLFYGGVTVYLAIVVMSFHQSLSYPRREPIPLPAVNYRLAPSKTEQPP